MISAFTVFSHLSNAFLIVLCGVVLLFLLKSVNLKDRLWLASVVSILLIVLISLGQIASYSTLAQRLQQQEASLDTLKMQYDVLKSETASARTTFGGAKQDVAASRKELGDLRNRVNAEFDRTIREIRNVYANISDEDLNRRFNDAVRKAKQNLQNNVFK